MGNCRDVSRRRVLRGGVAAAAWCIVPRGVVGGAASKPPSDRLNIAGVGLGAMGSDNLKACETETIAALCDVDARMASPTFARYPKAKRYRDYRRMLDRERGIDAVVVATPDHTHAVITAAAMKAGKHVYTQMPLAHDVWEARQLVGIARETKVATQMGNSRHSGGGVRRACEWIWADVIGAVREAHCWTDQPRWPQGGDRPIHAPAVPSHVDWDLWLGPAPERPYHRAYHPYRWRGWRDFGTGALGAMGCHTLDAAFWALKLGEADRFTVEATSTGVRGETWPKASTVRYRFPARGAMPPVTLTWHDGGRKPPRPKEMPESREHVGSNGTFFVGDKGTAVFGATVNAGPIRFVTALQLLPESRMQAVKAPRETLPRVKGWQRDGRHENEWVRACKGGTTPCSRFEVAGPLAEMALLGNVALLAGKPLEWDSKAMKNVNEPDANRHLRREYRRGWSL